MNALISLTTLACRNEDALMNENAFQCLPLPHDTISFNQSTEPCIFATAVASVVNGFNIVRVVFVAALYIPNAP